MDQNNIRNLNRLLGPDVDKKVSLLMEYANEYRDVADPWYTRDFKTAADDITRGCNALYKYIKKNHL